VKPKRLFLVSCVSKKKIERTCESDLYMKSAWFVKVRRLVEATGAPWFILSA